MTLQATTFLEAGYTASELHLYGEFVQTNEFSIGCTNRPSINVTEGFVP